MYLAALHGQDIVDGPRRAPKRRRPSRATDIILNTTSTDGRLAGRPLSEAKNYVLAHARVHWGIPNFKRSPHVCPFVRDRADRGTQMGTRIPQKIKTKRKRKEEEMRRKCKSEEIGEREDGTKKDEANRNTKL